MNAEYVICEALSASGLQTQVQEYVRQGFAPVGGLVVLPDNLDSRRFAYFQPLFKVTNPRK